MVRTYGTCRGCGAKLFRAEYVRFGKVDTEAEEKASGVSRAHEGGDVYSWIHTPCPHCDEPRPLSRRWRGWAIIVSFAVLFGLGIWLEVSG